MNQAMPATDTPAGDALLLPPDAAHHHGSHVQLLGRQSPLCSPREVDAVVVPTARSVEHLRNAMSLARELNCVLVALCSRWAFARATFEEAERQGRAVTAVDVAGRIEIPDFTSTSLLAGTRFERKTDTSLKRNIGLALATMMGWERIVYLDDDIVVEQPDDMRLAAGLLDHYTAVGLENNGFPDNSVVCHAYRAVGGSQDSFIGGGALTVSVSRAPSFFPNIYNEDWFFLLADDRLSPVGRTGKVTQRSFNPYVNARRARAEELGDCLAEGIFALLDDGRRVRDADEEFWRGFLETRRQFIAGILAKIPRLDTAQRKKRMMTEALNAAQRRRGHITPDLCVRYLQAWAADREQWRTYLANLPPYDDPDLALRHLGLSAYVRPLVAESPPPNQDRRPRWRAYLRA